MPDTRETATCSDHDTGATIREAIEKGYRLDAGPYTPSGFYALFYQWQDLGECDECNIVNPENWGKPSIAPTLGEAIRLAWETEKAA